MTANPYAFGSLGERWVDKESTTLTRLNKARIKCDANRWSLQQIMADPDDSTSALLVGITSTMTPPSSVQAAESAQRIIPVMLDNAESVWDLSAALQQARHASWWASLGAPPTHGALFIHEDQVSVTWWNLDTDAQYLQIDGAANGIIDDATPLLTDIAFLDFKIYLSGTGGASVTIIDLLGDRSDRFSTSGHEQFDATLGAFAGTDGYSVLRSGTAIVNNTCYGVVPIRDPSLTDELGRPKHWWVVGTDGGASFYNPTADAIYDTSSTEDFDNLTIDPATGYAPLHVDSAARDHVQMHAVLAVAADGVGQPSATYQNGTGIGNGTEIPLGAATINQAVGVLSGGAAIDGGPLLMIGSDAGLAMVHVDLSDADGGSGIILFDADVVTPYMKGDKRAAWPLNGLTDFSGNSHTLTNNNAVTFSNGGPAGSYADFVAASSMSLTLADHADFDGMSNLTVGCWIYRDIDSGGLETVVSKYDQGDAADGSWLLSVNASDALNFTVRTSANAATNGVASSVPLAQWVYAVGTYDGANVRLYHNGILVATTAQTGTVNDGTEIIVIGAGSSAGSPTNFFDGRIGGVFVTATAMTAAEIAWEYQRGLRRIASTVDVNDALSNVDVVSIRVDQASKHFIVTTADGNVTILDQFGVPILQDAVPSGTLRDACIWMPSGQDNPSYAIAGSSDVEFVQQARRILG